MFNRLGSRLGSPGVGSISTTEETLIFDQFTTARPVGQITGTLTEPSGHTRVDTDPDGIHTLTGGEYAINGTASNVVAGYISPLYARIPGRALYYKSTLRTTPAQARAAWTAGALANTSIATGGDIIATNQMHVRSNFSVPVNSAVIAASGSELVEGFAIQRQNGGFFLSRAGGAGNYRLWWVYRDGLYDQSYCNAVIQQGVVGATNVKFDDFKIIDLPAPFNSEYGLATDRKASPIVSDTLTHTADAIVEFTWTPLSSGLLDLMVRRTDDNNTLIVRCDQANSNIKVFEKVAGTETQKGSTGTQTWTVGTVYRVVVSLYGTAIVATVDLVNKVTTTSSVNTTSTGAKTNLAGLEFISWPASVAPALLVAGPRKAIDWQGDEYLSEIVRLRTTLAAGGAHNIVYLGGSITNGSSSSDFATTSWRAKVSAWLNAEFPTATLTHVNSGVGGTPSWYGLVRLQTDVIAHNPKLVIIDFAVNDSTFTYDQPSAEALIRRLRTALPTATLMCIFNFQVADPNVDLAANVKATVLAWWKAMCVRYHMPWFDFSVAMANVVTNGGHLITYMADIVHPDDDGHAVIAAGVKSILSRTTAIDTAISWSDHLAIIARSGTLTSIYENTPTVINGASGTSQVGTWAVDGTSIYSSDAATPATITFTATCQSWGLDTNYGVGSGVLHYSIDGAAFVAYDLTALGQTYQPVTALASRASHTFVLKVISGTIRINRFMAI